MGRFPLAAWMFAGTLLLAQQKPAGPSLADIESLVRSQHYDQALVATRASLVHAPKDFKLWTLEGIIYSLKDSKVEALKAFDKALILSPGYTPALKGEVQLLYPTGDERAVALLKQILKVEPGDRTAREMLAMLERKQGDCRAAVDDFAADAEAIKSHPQSLEAYGDCLAQLDRLDQAVPVLEQLTALLPERSYPKYDLAVVLLRTGQNEAALKVLEPLLGPDQSDPDVLSLASQAYEAIGNTPKAVETLRRAIVLSPTTANYYAAFAALCLSHDSFQVGIDMLNAGLSRIPGDPSLYTARGLLYAQVAQYDKAEADFEKVEELDSAQGLGSYAVDLTEMQRNNPEQALARVQSQLKAHPDNALLNYLLAQLLMDKAPAPDSEGFQEAMKAAQLAVKLKPDLAGARDILANMYMHSGQYDLAIEQCRLALKTIPSDETAMYHLIISLRHTGQNEEVKSLVKQLSEMHQASLRAETDRKRYRLVEAEAAPANQAP